MAKVGTLTHPKTKRLARRLKLPPFAAMGLLEAVWQWVARYKPTGFVTAEDLEMLGQELDLKRTKLADILLETGWLDEDNEGFYIHDWHEHATDLAKKNLRRAGKKFHREHTFEPEFRETVANESGQVRDQFAPTINKTKHNHNHNHNLALLCSKFENLNPDLIRRYAEWRIAQGWGWNDRHFEPTLTVANDLGERGNEYLDWCMIERKNPLRKPNVTWFLDRDEPPAERERTPRREPVARATPAEEVGICE